MIETVVGLVALFGAIAIIFVKLYNITAILKRKPFLDNKGTFFTLIGLLLCWGLYFLAFAGTLQYTETITTGIETFTISSSAYASFGFFLPAMNFFLILGIMLTVLEVVSMFANKHNRGWRE